MHFLKRFTAVIVAVSLLAGLSGCGRKFDTKGYDYSWLDKNKYICHALGAIDEYSYTNSKEAFLANYEKGYRVFEFDLKFTSDDKLVLFHSWRNRDLRKILDIDREKSENKEPLSSEAFLNSKIYGKYTPLSFDEFAQMINDYPDCYFVIDGKYGADEADMIEKEYQRIYETLNKYAPQMLDHMIPQIYYEDMLDWIMNVYKWKSVIYTWYSFDIDPTFEASKEADFAKEHGIKVITLNEDREASLQENGELKSLLLDEGFVCFVHTINDTAQVEQYEKDGIYGFYTDSLDVN